METKLYAERDPYKQDSTPNPITGEKWGNYYCRHVGAMTAEILHNKSDIAMELAHRDIQIDALCSTIERLREYAWHKASCSRFPDLPFDCDCGYDELMKELEETK